MYAGDDLHLPPVAVPQSAAINRFHAPHVGGPVLGQWDVGVIGNHAGHARRPKHFLIKLRIRKLVNVTNALQRLPGRRESRRYELKQCFRKIRRDVTVRQGGPESSRMCFQR